MPPLLAVDFRMRKTLLSLFKPTCRFEVGKTLEGCDEIEMKGWCELKKIVLIGAQVFFLLGASMLPALAGAKSKELKNFCRYEKRAGTEYVLMVIEMDGVEFIQNLTKEINPHASFADYKADGGPVRFSGRRDHLQITVNEEFNHVWVFNNSCDFTGKGANYLFDILGPRKLGKNLFGCIDKLYGVPLASPGCGFRL